jgi:carbonic anhydrase/acetyltransferase-like protein (isoleucine patch superfamily)
VPKVRIISKQAKDREDGAYLAQTVKNEDGYFHTACHIGAQAVIGRNSIIGVGAQIGEKTIVSPNCVIDSVPLELTILIGVISPAIVEEGCYLGPGCMLSADVRIGEYSYLYPGTVITSSTWVIDYNGEKCARGETPPYSVLRNSMYEGAFERDRYAQPAVRVVRRLDRNDVARLNRHQIMYEGML